MKIKKIGILSLLMGVSMVVTGCNSTQENTVQVENKELKNAIEKKVKELTAMLMSEDNDVYTKKSIINYNADIKNSISEIEQLKNVKEVNDYEIEISSTLTKKTVYSTIASITEPTNDIITVKGVVVATYSPRKIMIDDGTGRINVFSAKKDNFSNINYREGDTVIVKGKVLKSKTTKSLQFVIEDGATVGETKLPVEVNNKPETYTGAMFNDICKKLGAVESFTSTSYEYHPLVSFVGKLDKQEDKSGNFYHYNFDVEGVDGKYLVSVNPNSILENDLVNGETYALTGYVDELVKNRFINVYGITAKRA